MKSPLKLLHAKHLNTFFNLHFFSGSKTNPEPNPTPSIIPTTDSYPEPTEPTTAQPVDPSKDACKLTKFDTITMIGGELHFFKDG